MGTDAADGFERAMSVNAEGFGSGHYEAAYHALMAALPLAKDLGDEARLLPVAQVAREQGRSIDSRAPSHRLSSQMAQSRAHESVFRLAVRQASLEARLLHSSKRSDRQDVPRRDESPSESDERP